MAKRIVSFDNFFSHCLRKAQLLDDRINLFHARMLRVVKMTENTVENVVLFTSYGNFPGLILIDW